jgi:hypothetical protein
MTGAVRGGRVVVTRISLVKLRRDVVRERALEMWLGPHADVVRGMPGVRDYVVALSGEPRDADEWDGVATLRFDSRDALERAFADAATRDELLRTRDQFIERVDAFVVAEHVVIGDARP